MPRYNEPLTSQEQQDMNTDVMDVLRRDDTTIIRNVFLGRLGEGDLSEARFNHLFDNGWLEMRVSDTPSINELIVTGAGSLYLSASLRDIGLKNGYWAA